MGKDADILEEVEWKTFTRRGDIFCLFYEKGFEVLRKKGVLVFITSNKWMKGGYGKSLRAFFATIDTKKIINLGPGIFHSATVDTNIYIGKNELFLNDVYGVNIENRSQLSALQESTLIPLKDVSGEAWVVRDDQDLQINQFIEQKGKPLIQWDIKINFGIKTGYNDAYIIDEHTRDKLIIEDKFSNDIIKPLARGKDIERYSISDSSLWIIIVKYGANEYLQKKYSAIYNHLLSHKEKLSKRGQCTNKDGNGQHHWLELDNNPSDAYLSQFATEKIVWKRVGSIMRFAYSDEEMYCLDSTCIATGEKIKYLTAVLNSKAGLYQLFKTSPQTGTGDQIISVQALEPLLVHYPTDEIEEKFNRLVDIILFIKKSFRPLLQSTSNEEVSLVFENVVDQMVFELYFEKHMKELEIDILQYFKFPALNKFSGNSEKKEAVIKSWYELQEKENKIRNRILVADSRSWIIKRINQTVSQG